MSKVFDFFQEAIKSCNVFTSPVNLRYKLDPDYNTFAGGMVSIILVILLMSVFFNAWMALLNKEDISSSTEVIREFDPTYMNVSSDDFMFTIGVSGLNLTEKSQKKYFNLKMTKHETINKVTTQKITTQFELEPCTESHWEHLGQQFVDTHKRQNLSGFLCPSKNTTIEFGGKYTSERFIYYKITFEKCTGKPDCRTQAEIDAWINANTSFYFNFYYSNTLLNPDKQQSVSMFFEDKDYTMFSPTMSTSTNLYVGEYVMETDESIFPWIETKIENGFIVNRGEKQSWNYMANPSEPYAKFYLRKSNVKLQIQRRFRKLDDMLSYIGGLFGIIAVAFGFVMKYYGQCCFQLEMCQNIFDYHNKKQNKVQIKHDLLGESPHSTGFHENDGSNNKHMDGWSTNQLSEENFDVIEPKDFGFLDFFLHILVYVPLKKFCNIKWRRMQIYEESLQEMRYKLDISQLMEKLTFFDRSINVLFDQDQLKLLYLQEKFNFQEVRNQRSMLSLRKDIVANLFGMVAQNIKNSSGDQIVEQKKSLKQIAIERSRKRIQTFMGAPALNVFQIFAKAGLKSNQEGDDDVNLPPDIKSALKKLDTKIEEGDVISIRIYNGLQYDLLQAFEKSKLNKNMYYVTNKKMKQGRRNKKMENGPMQQKIEYPIGLIDIGGAQSITQINRIKQQEI